MFVYIWCRTFLQDFLTLKSNGPNTQNIFEMPIFYSVISRGTTVLAKKAAYAGNFAEFTEQFIKFIPSINQKLTFVHGKFLIHFNCEDHVIYMCITDAECERSRAFMFLAEIKRKFFMLNGQQAISCAEFNAEFSSILAYEMKHYNDEFEAVSRVHEKTSDRANNMVENSGNIHSNQAF